jgi:hypothetical protein
MPTSHQPLLPLQRSLALLASLVFSAAALAQTTAVKPNDPNDPIVKLLRNAEASELLPLKDYCLEKYPQFASSLETQLKASLQSLYGPDYPAKVKKFVATQDFKKSRDGAFMVFRAWPEQVQLERCQNLPPAIVYEAEAIDGFRRMAEEGLPSAVQYVRECNALYPGEKYSQIVLNERIENLYGEGPQAQAKFAAFLAKPETKAELANSLTRFEEDRRKSDYRLLDQCFSAERRKSGVPLPAKRP